ncbi:hypothetical protein K470DRAFT_254292 [Piedraia hortae CBS 480.64]|uniref:Uncharacterized protein n=1 Tax=Piedraia hortae CBS 480.64 TaxID=1314780 RepID=A0A6A7CBT1_9PEZI|nr:hypothetical protein K470DRAFT_254292 [Piedraia hortae CBS 480.64]
MDTDLDMSVPPPSPPRSIPPAPRSISPPPENHPCRKKLLIRGVETFIPSDAEAYANQHLPRGRVEWVSDESFNLVFGSESDAVVALRGIEELSHGEGGEGGDWDERPAKPCNGKEGVELWVRRARESDVKVRDARVRSRFYLMNPGFDPEVVGFRRGYRRGDGRVVKKRRSASPERKELFPDRKGDRGALRERDTTPRELFPEKRRGGLSIEKLSGVGYEERRPPRELFPQRQEQREFSFKGAAAKDDDFSFLGASRGRNLARDLFPSKVAGQQQGFGLGDGRTRAEDLL